MSNEISSELKAQIFAQESGDPYLTLLELSHASFDTIRLVNNTKDIFSRGATYQAFPMKIRLPIDDGEQARDFGIELDNVSLELIQALRSVTTEIDVKILFILASLPDVIQMEHEDLKLRNITYDAKRIAAKIAMDNFLSVAMTSEKYTPTNFPGMF